MTDGSILYPLRHIANPRARAAAPFGGRAAELFDRTGFDAVWGEVRSWPGYAATPLYDLRGLAAAAGIDRLWYKDEGPRFGLGAFKALGGGYAVFRLLAAEVARRTGRNTSSAELLARRHRALTGAITVTCATAGNHGKGVAWGARIFGCEAVIYISEFVSAARERGLADLGASVVRVPGHYEASLRRSEAAAAANGWILVTDTAGADYGPIQIDILAGYRVLAEEAVRQLPDDEPPTHVFIQGGVGGLAAGVLAHLWFRYGANRPRFVVVEPENANALMLTAEAGAPAEVSGDLETMMGCLAAAEIHHVAWEILTDCADDFLAIPDQPAIDLMRRLAAGSAGDRRVVVGESGVAGVAGLWAAAGSETTRTALGLGPSSRILVIGSEGANDAEAYRRIVGKSPERVLARKKDAR
ncbi:MAG: diaminopropionate ammonia-lyase [Alphaproteobacteria bacterium]